MTPGATNIEGKALDGPDKMNLRTFMRMGEHTHINHKKTPIQQSRNQRTISVENVIFFKTLLLVVWISSLLCITGQAVSPFKLMGNQVQVLSTTATVFPLISETYPPDSTSPEILFISCPQHPLVRG